LNNAEEKEVFQTYKFIKSRLIEKLSSIQNSQKKLKIEFIEKCEAFLKAMYSSSSKIQINEELLSDESIYWSRVIEEKIKHAVNFFASRKALKSDNMSFAIVQRMYKSILEIFNLVYSDLIENDYHSKIWCKGTEIILKKSDKSDYSISKTYRIIMLLNCSGKIAEKIIVIRLSYTAELNNKLLNFDQMRDRKQRSAINAVLNLIHDMQMTKNCKNTFICLLLNVKKVFDHVALKQLVKILIKLKILINLINWIKCFFIKSSYWLSIWWWTSEIKENNHRNITRLIYFTHLIFNLYSIFIFEDSSKVRKFTFTQLH
jgi:hypothetical protein